MEFGEAKVLGADGLLPEVMDLGQAFEVAEVEDIPEVRGKELIRQKAHVESLQVLNELREVLLLDRIELIE